MRKWVSIAPLRQGESRDSNCVEVSELIDLVVEMIEKVHHLFDSLRIITRRIIIVLSIPITTRDKTDDFRISFLETVLLASSLEKLGLRTDDRLVDFELVRAAADREIGVVAGL
jgi:hypothetical protein